MTTSSQILKTDYFSKAKGFKGNPFKALIYLW